MLHALWEGFISTFDLQVAAWQSGFSMFNTGGWQPYFEAMRERMNS